MITHAFDAVSRRAAEGISRRRSLLTFGAAAFGGTLAGPSASDARKKGKTCRKKERQRCTNDAAACSATLQTLCATSPLTNCLSLESCCTTCSAEGFWNCLIEAAGQ